MVEVIIYVLWIQFCNYLFHCLFIQLCTDFFYFIDWGFTWHAVRLKPVVFNHATFTMYLSI